MERSSSTASESSPELWWRSIVKGFTPLPNLQLPENVKSGIVFNTICINVPRHLQYLLSLFLSNGGTLLRASLPTDHGLAGALKASMELVKAKGLGEPRRFVNATGLGAGILVGDSTVFPTRGQTVLVQGEAKVARTKDGDTYVIPRPGSGTTILGGTREEGNW